MSAIVFGKADPLDYWEPLCHCGHPKADHEDSDDDCCWHGWTNKKEGCQCAEWSPDLTTGRGVAGCSPRGR